MHSIDEESLFYSSDHEEVLSDTESVSADNFYTLDWMERASYHILEKSPSTLTNNTGVYVDWLSSFPDEIILNYTRNFFILLEEPVCCTCFNHCCMVELNLMEGYWTYIDATFNTHKEEMLGSKFSRIIENFSLEYKPYRCQQQKSVDKCTIILLKTLEAKLIGENSPIFLSREDLAVNKKILENIFLELPDDEDSIQFDHF